MRNIPWQNFSRREPLPPCRRTPPPPWTPPPQTKVTIVGKNEIYRWENLVGPFLVHNILPSNTSLPTHSLKHIRQGTTLQHTVTRRMCSPPHSRMHYGVHIHMRAALHIILCALLSTVLRTALRTCLHTSGASRSGTSAHLHVQARTGTPPPCANNAHVQTMRGVVSTLFGVLRLGGGIQRWLTGTTGSFLYADLCTHSVQDLNRLTSRLNVLFPQLF